MIRWNKIAGAASRRMRTSPAVTAWRPACMALLILMSLSACRTAGPKVISADQTLVRLQAGKTYVAPVDGWFMTDALYQRYRKAVADRILEEQSK